MTERPTHGLIGLGTMGAALALNIAENGYPLAVHNRTWDVTEAFVASAGPLAGWLTPARTLEAFVDAITPPRTIILMLPAGPVVDTQIDALRPLLSEGDLIIDAGNANFADTLRRTEQAKLESFGFLGIGVSGGEEGARRGPAIMAGGTGEHWSRVGPLLEDISAKYQGDPCAAHMGPGGAGHFVKMVHNGIEYADMQMISEVYSIMRDGMGFEPGTIAETFEAWNDGPLASFLVEISAQIARTNDPISGHPMLEVIRDTAGQKGTGRWTAIEAQHLAVPVPVIEAAVAARNLSARFDERQRGADVFGDMPNPLPQGGPSIRSFEKALMAGKILCYAQGFEMLSTASRQHGWGLPMDTIARVWRAGCIIRSDMLTEMAEALSSNGDQNLIFSEHFTALLRNSEQALRETVIAATRAGIAVPALSAGLAWFDTMRTRRTPANMIQAQRDFFGAHGFERIDGMDAPHGPWIASVA